MRLHVIIAPSTFDETNYRTLKEGGKGGGGRGVGYRSRFTENKRERFGKSRFTAAMEITIREKKKEPFHISRGNKKGQ